MNGAKGALSPTSSGALRPGADIFAPAECSDASWVQLVERLNGTIAMLSAELDGWRTWWASSSPAPAASLDGDLVTRVGVLESQNKALTAAQARLQGSLPVAVEKSVHQRFSVLVEIASAAAKEVSAAAAREAVEGIAQNFQKSFMQAIREHDRLMQGAIDQLAERLDRDLAELRQLFNDRTNMMDARLQVVGKRTSSWAEAPPKDVHDMMCSKALFPIQKEDRADRGTGLDTASPSASLAGVAEAPDTTPRVVTSCPTCR